MDNQKCNPCKTNCVECSKETCKKCKVNFDLIEGSCICPEIFLSDEQSCERITCETHYVIEDGKCTEYQLTTEEKVKESMAQRSTTEINVINGPSTEIEAVLIWVLIIIMFGSFAMFCLCCLERKRKNNIHPQRQKPLPPSPMKPRKRNVPKI